MLRLDDFYGRTVEVPEDRRYDGERELWLRESPVGVRLGLTLVGVVLSGGIETIDPVAAPGDHISEGDVVFEVEAFKASHDVTAPFAGTVEAVNVEVIDDPELLDEDCYGAGWLMDVRPDDEAVLGRFSDASAYVATLRASEHCASDDGVPEPGTAEIGSAAVGRPAGANESAAKEEAGRRYGTRAGNGCSCCGDDESAECVEALYPKGGSAQLPDELRRMATGCCNPAALARLKPGMRVVDIGSGSGVDAILAAIKVGPNGSVVGIDMATNMVAGATRLAHESAAGNVEFRPGEMEDVPVEDEWADVVISNCAVNLSLRKDRAFAEAFRVLRDGGVLAVSDLVTRKPLPEAVRRNPAAWPRCVSGAVSLDKYMAFVERAGFMRPKVESVVEYSPERVAALSEVDREAFAVDGALSDEDLASLEGVLARVRMVTLKVGCC